jgi:membrane-bound lytic murein transglycosylase MltF
VLAEQAVSVARCESGLNPSARNPAGYYGLFQLGAGHAAAFRNVTGRDFLDAWDEAGPNSRYAKWLYDRSGSWSQWGCKP